MSVRTPIKLVATRDIFAPRYRPLYFTKRSISFGFKLLTDLCALLQSKNDKGERGTTTTTANAKVFTYSINRKFKSLQFQNSIPHQTLQRTRYS